MRVPDVKAVSDAHQTLSFVFFTQKGDINYFIVVGKPIIVLNSYQAARNLLEKRSGIYSGRPRLVILAELCAYFFHLNHLGSNLTP